MSRAAWPCSWCGEPIEAGTLYSTETVPVGLYFVARSYHVECSDALELYREANEDVTPPTGIMARGGVVQQGVQP